MSKLTVQFMENGEFDLPSEDTMRTWIAACIERDTTLNVLFVDEDEGFALNSQYRHKDYATNVLTFDYQHEPEAIADLAICVPVLVREAKSKKSLLKSIWHTYLFMEHCTLTVTIT